jgi:hypothetical protein
MTKINNEINGMSASGKVCNLLLTVLADNSLGFTNELGGCALLLLCAGMSNIYAEKDTLTVTNSNRIRTYVVVSFMTHNF